MKVKDLIRILSEADQELEVATHTHGHTAYHTRMRVALMHTWRGPVVVIGDLQRRHTNHPTDYVTAEIDGDERMPDNYSTYK